MTDGTRDAVGAIVALERVAGARVRVDSTYGDLYPSPLVEERRNNDELDG